MAAIKTKGLTKRFGNLVAVDSVDLEIEEGELFGLLGPNGAGKSTLVHMLSTILSPTEGEAHIYGNSVTKDPDLVRSIIGIVFQDPSSDEELTGYENLIFHGRMYGVPKKKREKRARKLLEMVELENRADDLVRGYSGGMRRRLELARGFLHDPRVLYLDEPTLGLDPQTRRRIWEYITKLNDEEGITMVLTTHYMEEADQLCDRVGVIDRGKIISLGSPEDLKNEMGGDIITLTMEDLDDFSEELKGLKSILDVNKEDGKFHLTVENGEKIIPRLMKLAHENGFEVESVNLRKPTLEDVFINLTGRSIREEEAGGSERMRIRQRSGDR
ncbi:ABC transporter ATP-binding protein [candidate division MSBL1 archaeon SCGC-AAA259E19]|uniref:ABC transporter ATP-binding protein n=1 Tax=candidate division MSBL1 archaeon SCGC-AAA259E19 TaxID=1698264 RepID=A0A133UN31_9EURY|nr:ABC transporter ATP-binding protein [candidate division MSBL1 archaeon SCGC-AAA259E19]